MLKGSCLCGAVRIETDAAIEHPPEACHCQMCRKHSGHFLAAVNIRKANLRIEGEDSIAWYQSSEKVRRGFCSVCGSTLFWAPVMPDYHFIAVAMGLFDTATNMRIAKHTFVGDRGDYYDIPDDGAARSDGY
jgi:hypothetical protein